MKDIDFLPEWYKAGHRHRVHMRHQYGILTAVVLAMITYNVMALHQINKVTAGLDRLDDQRRIAEQVIYDFDAVSTQLRQQQAKVDLIAQIDSKIDVSAVLAELSHIIDGRVVLSRLDFISEPIGSGKDQNRNNTTIRPVTGAGGMKSTPMGDVCFRIVMAGVATNPGDVGDIAEKLERSDYFRQVFPSVSRSGKVDIAVPAALDTAGRTVSVPASEFEITCYLHSYEEVKGG